MAHYCGPVCRLCRREGMKLFLKGTKCTTVKCPFEKRSFPPGAHGQARIKLSDYGVQLREKQKVKRLYGLFERQFRRTFRIASRSKGVTGQVLLSLLERRLDNFAYRMGWAVSRRQARQLVGHGHLEVNGRSVNIASFSVSPDDAIRIRGDEAFIKQIQERLEILKDRPIVSWVSRDPDGLSAKVLRVPERSDVGFPIREQMIVELYSK